MSQLYFLSHFYCRHLRQNGYCKFGDKCMFSHSSSALNVPDHVCLYNLKEKCRFANCSFLHISASDLITQLRVLKSYSNDEPSTSDEISKSACKPKQRNFKSKDFEASCEERLCGICLEDVGGRKRFGLLSSCDHVFCFDCIMTWRKTKNDSSESDTQNCPECRMPSSLVVSSSYYSQGEERMRLIEEFKMRSKQKMCKFEKNGENNCLKQHKCIFKHTLPFKPQPQIDHHTRQYWYNITNANVISLNSILSDSGDEDIYISIQNAYM